MAVIFRKRVLGASVGVIAIAAAVYVARGPAGPMAKSSQTSAAFPSSEGANAVKVEDALPAASPQKLTLDQARRLDEARQGAVRDCNKIELKSAKVIAVIEGEGMSAKYIMIEEPTVAQYKQYADIVARSFAGLDFPGVNTARVETLGRYINYLAPVKVITRMIRSDPTAPAGAKPWESYREIYIPTRESISVSDDKTTIRNVVQTKGLGEEEVERYLHLLELEFEGEQ